MLNPLSLYPGSASCSFLVLIRFEILHRFMLFDHTKSVQQLWQTLVVAYLTANLLP